MTATGLPSEDRGGALLRATALSPDACVSGLAVLVDAETDRPGPPPPPFFFNIILALVHSERAFRRGLMQVRFLPLSSPPWSLSTRPRPRSGSPRGSAWATRQPPPVTLLVSFQLLGLSGAQEPGNSTPDVPASGPARPAP